MHSERPDPARCGDSSDFDGQGQYSDDGQLAVERDPGVYTGQAGSPFVPPLSAFSPGFAVPRNPRDPRPLVSYEPAHDPPVRRRRARSTRTGGDAAWLSDAGATNYAADRYAGGRAKAIEAADKAKRTAALAQGRYKPQPGGDDPPGAVVDAIDRRIEAIRGKANAFLAATKGGLGLELLPGKGAGLDGSFLYEMDRLYCMRAGDTRKGLNWREHFTYNPGALESIGSAIGSAVSSVGSAVASVATGIGRPLGALITSPIHLVSDIATGKNVLASLSNTVKRDLGSVGDLAPYVQAVLSVVPGVGTGINAAIAAGAALAHGQSITDAIVAGAKGMIPGGPLAAQALETAYQMAKGKNVVTAIADAARKQIPGGELAQRAFDTGLALAHGANLQQTIAEQGGKLVGSVLPDSDLARRALSTAVSVAGGANVAATLKGASMSLLSDSVSNLSPINRRVTSITGPQFIGAAVEHAVSLVPSTVNRVAQGILQNPALRGRSVGELAQQFHVPVETARSAVASLVQTVQRAGQPSLSHMVPAADIARRISTGMNFEQAMMHFGSNVGPQRFSPNARTRPVALHWRNAPGGRVTPHIAEASGLDASGVAYLVEPGDSMQKIAAKLTGSGARVRELIAANPQVKNPNVIQVGQKLNLPASWQTKAAVPANAPPMTTLGSPNAAPSPMPTFPGPVAPAVVAGAMPVLSEQAKSSGAAVRAWQAILIRDKIAAPGTDDGMFGPNTSARTKAWQSAHGISPDGVVGPQTWAAALATIPAVIAAQVPAVLMPTDVMQVPVPGLPGVSLPVPTWSAPPSPTTYGPPDPPTLALPPGPVALPAPPGPPVMTTGTGRVYLVLDGDSMVRISVKFTGSPANVRELIAANPQVPNPDLIYPGQRLNVPANWPALPSTGGGPYTPPSAPPKGVPLPAAPPVPGKPAVKAGAISKAGVGGLVPILLLLGGVALIGQGSRGKLVA